MKLSSIPAVRALAETRANDLHRILFGRPTDGDRFAQWREAHLDLLCDLTRSESRDAIARLVAERAGLLCGATAPEFKRTAGKDGWLLRTGWAGQELSFVEGTRRWTTFRLRPQDFFMCAALDGIGTTTDPADALALIATHVLGTTP